MFQLFANFINSKFSVKKWLQKVSALVFAKNTYLSFIYEGWEWVNLGDNIQTIATKNAVLSFCPNARFIEWNRNNLANYLGDKCTCIMQGFFPPIPDALFPNKKITPVYIGYHLGGDGDEMSFVYSKHLTNTEKLVLDKLNYYEGKTVGARDHRTTNFFKDHGIDSYYSRCLTLTFPKRKIEPKNPKVFLADVHQELLPFIPKRLLENAIYTWPKIRPIPNATNIDYMQMAQRELDNYRDHAGLVITNRIHVAAPCLAMGIKVILYKRSESDVRYEIFDGILSVYQMEDFKKGIVDFNPKSIKIEELKKLLLENLKLSCRSPNSKKLKQIRHKISTYKAN